MTQISYIIVTSHIPHTKPTMNNNPTIHPDCILDHTGTLNLVLIRLFISVLAYMYKARAIQTVTVSIINVALVICALLGFKGWGFMFHGVV